MKTIHMLALIGIVVIVGYIWTTLGRDAAPAQATSRFDEIVYQFVGKYTPLTELQKREDWGKYRGLSVQGGGTIREMSGSLVKLEHPKNRYENGASIFFNESESLSKFKVGDLISFTGRLDGYSNSEGLIVRDAVLLLSQQS